MIREVILKEKLRTEAQRPEAAVVREIIKNMEAKDERE